MEKGLGNIQLERIGIPDKFIQHGSRKVLLNILGLDKEGIIMTSRQMINPEKRTTNAQLNIYEEK